MKRETLAITILTLASPVLVAACAYVAFKAIDYRRHVNYFLDKYTYVVADFSGRQQYAADNANVAASGNPETRVVFMGDQMIESWDLTRYFPGRDAINRGITGQWLAGFVLRLRPDALDLKPRAVIIQFSSYNFRPQSTVAEVKDYLVSLAELCRYNGVEPLLTTVAPVRAGEDVYAAEGFDPYFVADTVAQFNRWLTAYCAGHGYQLIDFNGALRDNAGRLAAEYSIDNTHLTEAGFARLAVVTRIALDQLERKIRAEAR